jgi:opacity protein-like surface antigen
MSMLKKTTAVTAASLCLLAWGSAAQAQTQEPYLGAGWTEIASESGIKIFGGAKFNTNFGWEANFTKVKELKVLAGHAKGYLPFHPQFTAFGKLGLNRLSGGGAKDTELGFGLGLEWKFDPKLAARIEYEDLGCTGDCDALTLGVKFSF